MKEKEYLLKRSLDRLGQAAKLGMPMWFVEHELSLAIRLFGTRTILWRMLKDCVLSLYCRATLWVTERI